MKRILIPIIAFFVLFAQSLIAETKPLPHVFVEFEQKTVFYPSSVDNNPIFIHVVISNPTSETLHFKLADDKMFSLDFVALTVQNQKLENSDFLIRTRSTSQRVFFRELNLDPGEEYGFIVDLKEYIIFKNPDLLYIEMNFYPELFKSMSQKIVSNRLTLEITPHTGALASSFIPVDFNTGNLLTPQALAPNAVVEQTIIARQRSLWDQFFLYMDIESLFQKNTIQKEKYARSSEQERMQLLNQFKKLLSSKSYDSDIVAIPERFTIERTTYTQSEGTVSVLMWFKYPSFKEKKRYVYYLRLRDGIWRIYDYSVENLGTE